MQSISFMWCKDIYVRGLTSINSQTIHMAIGQSKNMRIEYITIRAPSRSPNTDGIHVQHSSDISIRRSIIKTGDDCVSIGPGTTNMWVERIGCGPGHGIRYFYSYYINAQIHDPLIINLHTIIL